MLNQVRRAQYRLDVLITDGCALQWSGCKIIFFDAGVYLVSDTITIPAGAQVVGEAWSTILGGGTNFQDYNNRERRLSASGSC